MSYPIFQLSGSLNPETVALFFLISSVLLCALSDTTCKDKLKRTMAKLTSKFFNK